MPSNNLIFFLDKGPLQNAHSCQKSSEDFLTNLRCYIMSRPRILFFSEGLTSSHIFRPFKLAQDLFHKGYDVHFACTQQSPLIKMSPEIPFYLLEGSISPLLFLNKLKKGRLPFTEKVILNNIQKDEEIIKRIKPDLVIDDMRLSLSITTEKQKIPHITLNNITWSPLYDKDSKIIPEVDLIKMVGMKLGTLLFILLKDRYQKAIIAPFNKIRSRQNLSQIPTLSDLYTSGQFVAYFDIPEFTPHLDLPDNHSFLGPLLFSYPCEKPKWWDSLNRNKPWIYLSLGSSGPLHVCHKILKTLTSNRDYEVIFSSSGRPFTSSYYPNLHWAPYLPDGEIISQCQLYIGNGGSPGSHQALAGGVPILAFPENYDQWLYADLLEKNNLASIFRPSKFSTKDLELTVKKRLAQDPIDTSISEKIRTTNPSQSLIKMIEQIHSSKKLAA